MKANRLNIIANVLLVGMDSFVRKKLINVGGNLVTMVALVSPVLVGFVACVLKDFLDLIVELM